MVCSSQEVGKLRTELGWEDSVSLDQGLDTCAEWLDASACEQQGLAMEVLPDEGFLDAVLAEARATEAFDADTLDEVERYLRDPKGWAPARG